MLDKKTLEVVIKGLVQHRLDLHRKLKEHDGVNRLSVYKVPHRGGYFTHGQMADMIAAQEYEITLVENDVRKELETAVDREPVIVEHTTTDLPKVRSLVLERWPWIYEDIKDFPIEEFVIEILMRKKTGGARTTTKPRS